MNAPHEHVKNLIYITLPKGKNRSIGEFVIDETIEVPLQLPDGKTSIDREDEVTIELIVAGMLKILAWQEDHPHLAYYRDFVLAAQPDAAEQLNIAAIAQEQKGDFLFAEELFRAVSQLANQSGAYINLATLYSRIAATDESRGEIYDENQQKALSTLRRGLVHFPDDRDILRELGFFHLYQGSVEVAKSYLERYLEDAPQGGTRDHVQRIVDDIEEKLTDDRTLMAAYDAIHMNREEQAIAELAPFLEANPTVWNAWFLRGWALRRLSRFAEATDAFLTALRHTEPNSDLYNELALCSLESGERELAKDYLNTAVDLDQKNLTLLSNLAYLHLEDAELDLAREYLERARALDPDDPLISTLVKDYQNQSGEMIPHPVVEEYVEAEEVLRHLTIKDSDHGHSEHL